MTCHASFLFRAYVEESRDGSEPVGRGEWNGAGRERAERKEASGKSM